ncbi:hypothetical protein VHEMI02819 [[Torrubiella] hemipterigena]|uniref:Ribonuclease H1 N-terminal domain-containing protein n=1 Tax=[Torrubiella] hemipterigena TaxID=1531966 RepID=A0A0A1SWU8_9HYPO|nr:hypothetical protein VHEMI02819 [[Torrubiella] hemipterigena]
MPQNYYVVLNGGRVEKPTIFSSWGDVHPRVAGCKAKYERFKKLEEAYKYLKDNGVEEGDYHEVINPTAGKTTPDKGSKAFYAVANGTRVGVFDCFCGEDGCKCQVEQAPGACHQRFRTRQQADAFREDWNESVAYIYYKEIKKALDEGKRPLDMKFDISGLRLVQRDIVDAVDDATSQLGDFTI